MKVISYGVLARGKGGHGPGFCFDSIELHWNSRPILLARYFLYKFLSEKLRGCRFFHESLIKLFTNFDHLKAS